MQKSKQNPSIPLPSLIIQGPSGCGKSTFARLYASEISSYKTLILETYDMAGISNVKQAAITLRGTGKRVLLVVDEIHLLKGKQQDSLLSMIENGLVTLVGVTSDSVLHKVRSSLRSRCWIILFEKLSPESLLRIAIGCLNRMTAKDDGTEKRELPSKETLLTLCTRAGGDARKLILDLEVVYLGGKSVLDATFVKTLQHNSVDLVQTKYDTISPIIKSMRASHIDAALLYLVQLLEMGESPVFIARRLAIFACEDVGIAEPLSGVVAESCCKLVDRLIEEQEETGRDCSKDIRTALANCVAYLSKCPKSSSVNNAVANFVSLIDRIGLNSEQLAPPREFLPSANLHSEQKTVYVHPMCNGNQMRYNCLPPALKDIRVYREDYIPKPPSFDS